MEENKELNQGQGTGAVEDAKIGEIQRINIEDQMKTAYIDYSMSVIVSRALPDVRDGLKHI